MVHMLKYEMMKPPHDCLLVFLMSVWRHQNLKENEEAEPECWDKTTLSKLEDHSIIPGEWVRRMTIEPLGKDTHIATWI